MNASIFTSSFTPFRNRYIYQGQGELWTPCWATAEGYLTNPLIDNAIAGQVIIGYFLSVSPRGFCVDIDDHTGKGYGYLLSIYDRVCQCLQSSPSVVAKSPHGLHAFYFLTHPVPEILLIDRVQTALQGVPVEVKPTHAIGLRIPQEKHLLHPHTLQALPGSFAEIIQSAPCYHPIELFSNGVTTGISPQEIRETLKHRQGKAVKTQVWQRLAKIERTYAGIMPGKTNDALCELVPVYRTAGLTQEEATAEFSALLVPQYEGELRNYRRLLQRVRSFYKHTPETRFNTAPVQLQRDLFSEGIADTLAALVTGAMDTPWQRKALTQKRHTVKKAVLRLENWRVYINGVVAHKRFLEMWNYIYPYFKKNTKEGYYPIPSQSLFRDILEHYERWLLPFFLEVGYLERSPYGYSAGNGICYYYHILGERFMDVQPLPKPVKPKTKAQIRAETIRAYKREHPNMSNRAIARTLGIPWATIQRILSTK